MAKKAKAARISYQVVKEQNFDGISIRVFCGYSDFEPVLQAHSEEIPKFFGKFCAFNSRRFHTTSALVSTL
jgi:hypothetical protein